MAVSTPTPSTQPCSTNLSWKESSLSTCVGMVGPKSMSVTEFTSLAARYPASSEYRCSANGLFDTSAYRDNPFIIRSRCFVQPKGIKLVRFRRHVTRRYVNFYPERNFIDVKLIPYQRTTDESGIFVIGNPTRIAPVGEPVDINEPVIC